MGKIKYRDFIKEHVGTQKGPLIVYETGEKKAEHDGFWFYTIGQRQGIGLSHGPWYVVAKDISSNSVYISNQYYGLEKQRDVVIINDIMGVIEVNKTYDIKLRHGEYLHTGTIISYENGAATIKLGLSDQGIAAGQCAVLYNNGVLVASGIINV